MNCKVFSLNHKLWFTLYLTCLLLSVFSIEAAKASTTELENIQIPVSCSSDISIQTNVISLADNNSNRFRRSPCTDSDQFLSDIRECLAYFRLEDANGQRNDEETCQRYRKALACLKNFTEKCEGEDIERRISKLYGGLIEVGEDVCITGGKYLNDTLLVGRCILEKIGSPDQCEEVALMEAKQIRAVQMNGTEVEKEESLVDYCCFFQEFIQCRHTIIFEMCGEKVANTSTKLLHALADPIFKELNCYLYQPGTLECLPAASNSMILRLSFSISFLFPSLLHHYLH